MFSSSEGLFIFTFDSITFQASYMERWYYFLVLDIPVKIVETVKYAWIFLKGSSLNAIDFLNHTINNYEWEPLLSWLVMSGINFHGY